MDPLPPCIPYGHPYGLCPYGHPSASALRPLGDVSKRLLCVLDASNAPGPGTDHLECVRLFTLDGSVFGGSNKTEAPTERLPPARLPFDSIDKV